MNDKYAREIAKELWLIRIELQRLTPKEAVSINTEFNGEQEKVTKAIAGDKVTIK